MPSISESGAGDHDDEDMSSVGANEIDDILDEAMDEEEEEELHNYSRSPRRMKSAAAAAPVESPTASAASWEFQTPSNPKVSPEFHHHNIKT